MNERAPIRHAALSLLALAVTTAAWAQSGEPAKPPSGSEPRADEAAPADRASALPEVEELVVTARRREENAQAVPVAITALSQTALDELHITTGQDLQGQIPSFSVSPGGQSRDVESYSLRGQSTTYTSAPAVVQYLAEVPLISGRVSSLQGAPGQFLDLANLQVLRGPQGTLFGRNSTGGAVLLEPAKPTEELGGYLQGEVGDYGDGGVEGVLNLPVNDRLAVRAAGRFATRDGFTKDVVTGTDYDNRHYFSGRLGVLWKPTDDITNYLMIGGSTSRTHGVGTVLGGWNVPFVDAVFGGGAPGGCAAVGLGANCAVLTQLANDQRARGIHRVSLGPKPLDSRMRGLSVIDQLSVQISDGLTLRNLFSYSQLAAFSPFDGDGSPLGMYNANLPHRRGWTDDYTQFTEEIQAQGSAFDDHLQYTAGVYYEKIHSPSALLVADSITFLGPGGNGIQLETDAKAIYAQATFDFGALLDALAGLKLTGGARYTWDRARGQGGGVFYDPSDGTTPVACSNGLTPATPSFATCAIHSRDRASSPSWTVGLDYRIDDHVMPYAKVTYGYKTGGINLYAVNPANTKFDPEYVTTYEGGVKTTFQLGSVATLFNVTGFYTRYRDIQVASGDFNLTTGAAGAAVFNAASARIQGVELEGMVTPVAGLELSANYSHLSGKYRTFSVDNPFGQFDCNGAFVFGSADLRCVPIPNLPRDQVSATARYALPLPERLGDVVVSANYAFTGDQFQSSAVPPAFEPGVKIGSYGLLNLSVNWNGVLTWPVDFSFFVTNATDERYRISNTGVFNSLGVQSSIYGAPRMFGAQLRYRW